MHKDLRSKIKAASLKVFRKSRLHAPRVQILSKNTFKKTNCRVVLDRYWTCKIILRRIDSCFFSEKLEAKDIIGELWFVPLRVGLFDFSH